MIDLENLEKKIDALLESETEESLTTWLFNKRFGNLNKLLGEGTFISLKGKTFPVFITPINKTKPTSASNNTPNTPNNRQAA